MTEHLKSTKIAVTPEDSELKEGSFWKRAQEELMRNTEKAEALKYLSEAASEIGMKVVPEALAEKATDLPIVESQLQREKQKSRKLGEDLTVAIRQSDDLRRRLEAMPIIGPAIPEAVPPPIMEPPRKGEMVIIRDCYPVFRELWNLIRKQAATSQASRVVKERTGLGIELISRGLSITKAKDTMRTEALVNRLLECECLGKVI